MTCGGARSMKGTRLTCIYIQISTCLHYIHAYGNVCIYTCMHAYIRDMYAGRHSCLHAYIHACLHTHMHRTLTYLYAPCICTHNKCGHECIRIIIRTGILTYMHTGMDACLQIYRYVYICIDLYMYMHACTHTHIFI